MRPGPSRFCAITKPAPAEVIFLVDRSDPGFLEGEELLVDAELVAPAQATVTDRLQFHLGMGGEEITETVDAHIRGGDGTPGVFREDRDRDGRLELHITPEGAAALPRPAMLQLAAKIMARTHPAPDSTMTPEK